MDEQKRAQAERLGMGMGRQTTNASIFSHSTASSMQTIEQTESESSAKSNFMDREPRRYGGETPADKQHARSHVFALHKATVQALTRGCPPPSVALKGDSKPTNAKFVR